MPMVELREDEFQWLIDDAKFWRQRAGKARREALEEAAKIAESAGHNWTAHQIRLLNDIALIEKAPVEGEGGA